MEETQLQMEGLMQDVETAVQEVPAAKQKTQRRMVAAAAMIATGLLIAVAAMMVGDQSGVSARGPGTLEALARKDEEKGSSKCGSDTSMCADDEYPNICAGRIRTKCCYQMGGPNTREHCCHKEGKTNLQIYTDEMCSAFCDAETPCKDEKNKTRLAYCKGVEKVKCCERTSDRVKCCAKDNTPKAVKNGHYCKPECDVEKACEEAKDKPSCQAKALQKCEEKKKCTANVPGKGVSCLDTGCCQDPKLACYEKNLHWAECRPGCTPGNQSDDHPEFRSPWTCRVLTGCSAPWQACLDNKCCRHGNGKKFQCYAKSPHWAQCREEGSCTPGIHTEDPLQHQTPWACKVINQSTKNLTFEGLGLQNPADAEDAGCAAAWGPCLKHKCCKSPLGKSFKCYAKNPHWAQCREDNNCVKGIHEEDPVKHRQPWACKVINKTTAELTWEGLGLERPKSVEDAKDTKTDGDDSKDSDADTDSDAPEKASDADKDSDDKDSDAPEKDSDADKDKD